MPVAWRHGPSHRTGGQCHASPLAARGESAGGPLPPSHSGCVETDSKVDTLDSGSYHVVSESMVTACHSVGHSKSRTLVSDPPARCPGPAGWSRDRDGHGDRDCQCGPGPQARPFELGLIIMPMAYFCWPMIAKWF
jgi:hypothetical protein